MGLHKWRQFCRVRSQRFELGCLDSQFKLCWNTYIVTPKLKNTTVETRLWHPTYTSTHAFPFCTVSPTHRPLWLRLCWEPNICRDCSPVLCPSGAPWPCSPCFAIQRCPHPNRLSEMVPGRCSLPSSPWGLPGPELAGPSPNHVRAMLCNGHTRLAH